MVVGQLDKCCEDDRDFQVVLFCNNFCLTNPPYFDSVSTFIDSVFLNPHLHLIVRVKFFSKSIFGSCSFFLFGHIFNLRDAVLVH